jgi:hypothetical protein
MTKQEIFQNVRQFILSLLPVEGWVKAELRMQIQPGGLGASCIGYFKDGSEVGLRARFGDELESQIEMLHRITIGEQGEGKWNKVTFILTETGELNSNFFWDDVWQSEIDRENDKAEKRVSGYKRPHWHWENKK